jgi:uncharacterized protein
MAGFMKHEKLSIPGNAAGQSFSLSVLRFTGSGGGPAVYMQAALHAQELPGLAALHYLLPMLEKAEAEGRLRSDITIVPHANPIGLSQSLFNQQQGRFDIETGINFNRRFPMPGEAVPDPGFAAAADTLKSSLMAMSAEAAIVLDLHCDDEGPLYLYVPHACWPAAAPLADALGAVAVLLWEGEGGGAFEDAIVKRWLHAAGGGPIPGKVTSTVELRGMADVSPELGRQDAAGLFRYLIAVGAVKGAVKPAEMHRKPVIRDQNCVDMVRTPEPGMILYHEAPGRFVKAGTLMAEIVSRPGEAGGTREIRAPRDGYYLTRRMRRHARRGDDIVKIIGDAPSEGTVPGPLEP